MYRIALACEGPTDRVIIQAILDHYLDDYEALPIQPPLSEIGGDAGSLGGGWRGVRRFCREGESTDAVRDNSDFLIIHVDADVAAHPEIDRAMPSPPPHGSAKEVRSLILEWLDADEVPESAVFCVPAMASETWVLVALFPESDAVVPCGNSAARADCVECRTDVKALLRRLGKRLRPKLVVGQVGRLKNQAMGYQSQHGAITRGWPDVVRICIEASRFNAELTAKLAAG